MIALMYNTEKGEISELQKPEIDGKLFRKAGYKDISDKSKKIVVSCSDGRSFEFPYETNTILYLGEERSYITIGEIGRKRDLFVSRFLGADSTYAYSDPSAVPVPGLYAFACSLDDDYSIKDHEGKTYRISITQNESFAKQKRTRFKIVKTIYAVNTLLHWPLAIYAIVALATSFKHMSYALSTTLLWFSTPVLLASYYYVPQFLTLILTGIYIHFLRKVEESRNGKILFVIMALTTFLALIMADFLRLLMRQ